MNLGTSGYNGTQLFKSTKKYVNGSLSDYFKMAFIYLMYTFRYYFLLILAKYFTYIRNININQVI